MVTASPAATATRAPTPKLPPTPMPLTSDGLAASVEATDARPHLEALQRIAGQHGGNRAAGTTGYEASVAYVTEQLEASGYTVVRHRFSLPGAGDSVSLLAERMGTGTGVIMLGAHLDSVVAGPGINDNGSGVAALLILADRLMTFAPPDRTVRFAFWGAEEEGPFGSQAYVDARDAEGVVAYLNFDMLASPNPVRFVYAETDAAPSSDELTRLFADAFESAGLDWEPIDLEGDSDHGPFIDAGVATGGLFSGGIEPVTDAQAAIFGADAGVPADPCSHRSCDTLDHIDEEVLDQMLDAMAVVLVALASEP